MVFLDANVLLELLLPHRQKRDEVKHLLKTLDEPTAISALTAQLVLHFGRFEPVADESLHLGIGQSTILSLSAEDYSWARKHEVGKDFEDALQMAVALRADCTSFITLDRALANNYTKNYSQKLQFIVP